MQYINIFYNRRTNSYTQKKKISNKEELNHIVKSLIDILPIKRQKDRQNSNYHA
jgi:hypothetical protein